jgi:hypothetical protein
VVSSPSLISLTIRSQFGPRNSRQLRAGADGRRGDQGVLVLCFRYCSEPVCGGRDLFLHLFLVCLRSIPFVPSVVREEGFGPLSCGGLRDLLST